MTSVPWLASLQGRLDQLEARTARLEVVLADCVAGVEALMGAHNRLEEEVSQSSAPRPHPPKDLPALDCCERTGQ